MFKRIFATLSVFAIVCLCGTSVHAGYVEATLTLTSTSSSATLYEDTLPPNTNKKLEGTYITVDALGETNTQSYRGSVQVGQLNVKSYAPSHFKSKKSYYSYSLNGILQSSLISKTY